MKNIILIGFMGSGKSSVASELAKKMQLAQLETDKLVLSFSKRKSISEIFSLDGEIQFRELELIAAKKLSKKKNSIISTGGGMVINKLCIDHLKKNGTVVFLQTTFDVIVKRLEGDTTRPLFINKDKAKKLFLFRENLYKEYADITVNTNLLSVGQITNLIFSKL